MATNAKIKNVIPNQQHNQLASSQANRTSFTPGKPSSLPGDENWPKEYQVAIPGRNLATWKWRYERTHLLRQNVIDNQTLTGVSTTSFDDSVVSNQIFNERRVGADWIVST